MGMNGEPNGMKAENCAAVRLNDGALAGTWLDVVCSDAKRYVCERGF